MIDVNKCIKKCTPVIYYSNVIGGTDRVEELLINYTVPRKRGNTILQDDLLPYETCAMEFSQIVVIKKVMENRCPYVNPQKHVGRENTTCSCS